MTDVVNQLGQALGQGYEKMVEGVEEVFKKAQTHSAQKANEEKVFIRGVQDKWHGLAKEALPKGWSEGSRGVFKLFGDLIIKEAFTPDANPSKAKDNRRIASGVVAGFFEPIAAFFSAPFGCNGDDGGQGAMSDTDGTASASGSDETGAVDETGDIGPVESGIQTSQLAGSSIVQDEFFRLNGGPLDGSYMGLAAPSAEGEAYQIELHSSGDSSSIRLNLPTQVEHPQNGPQNITAYSSLLPFNKTGQEGDSLALLSFELESGQSGGFIVVDLEEAGSDGSDVTPLAANFYTSHLKAEAPNYSTVALKKMTLEAQDVDTLITILQPEDPSQDQALVMWFTLSEEGQSVAFTDLTYSYQPADPADSFLQEPNGLRLELQDIKSVGVGLGHLVFGATLRNFPGTTILYRLSVDYTNIGPSHAFDYSSETFGLSQLYPGEEAFFVDSNGDSFFDKVFFVAHNNGEQRLIYWNLENGTVTSHTIPNLDGEGSLSFNPESNHSLKVSSVPKNSLGSPDLQYGQVVSNIDGEVRVLVFSIEATSGDWQWYAPFLNPEGEESISLSDWYGPLSPQDQVAALLPAEGAGGLAALVINQAGCPDNDETEGACLYEFEGNYGSDG